MNTRSAKLRRIFVAIIMALLIIVVGVVVANALVTIQKPDKTYRVKSDISGNVYEIVQHPGAISPFIQTTFKITVSKENKAVAKQGFWIDTMQVCSALLGATGCDLLSVQEKSDAQGKLVYKYRGGMLTAFPGRDYVIQFYLIDTNSSQPTYDARLDF